MAPFMGPSRAEVLRILRSASAREKLPLTLGYGTPQALIQFDGASWVLRPLVRDAVKDAQIANEARARNGMYVPEMTWAALVPGPALVSSTSLEEFIVRLEKMDWPYSAGTRARPPVVRPP